MTILVSDTFTAVNNTAINGRTPDTTVSGRTWTAGNTYNNAGTLTGIADIQSNKARLTAPDDGFTIDTGQADFQVVVNMTTPSSFATTFRGGFIYRASLQANGFSSAALRDFYYLIIRYDLGTAQIRMIKAVDGVQTDVGTNTTFSFSTSTNYKITLTAVGSTYKVYVDDVLKKTETDSTYTTQTIHGAVAGILGQDFFMNDIEFSTISSTTVFRRTESERSGSRN